MGKFCCTFDGTIQEAVEYLVPDGYTFNTRFESASATGTASSTVFTVGYYLDLNEYNQQNRPDTIMVTITSENSTQEGLVKKLILLLSTGSATTTITYNGSTSLPDGNYTGWVNFYNFTSGWITFGQANITVNFTISGGLVTTYSIVNMTDGLTPFISSNSICQEAGAFSSICAIAQFFYTVPQELAKQAFLGVFTLLQSVPPMSTYYAIKTQVQAISLSGTSTPGFSIQMPFDTTQDFLTDEQLDTWTGGKMDDMRNLTTVSLYVLFFIYFVHLVTKRIV